MSSILSLATWWVVVPILGMMYLVAVPIVVILAFSSLKNGSKLYSYGLLGVIVLYAIGVLGFIYGLSDPELYGLHIQLAELAYKVALPILFVILAIPLCLSKTEFELIHLPEIVRSWFKI